MENRTQISPLITLANEKINQLIDEIVHFRKVGLIGYCPPFVFGARSCDSGGCELCKTDYLTRYRKELEEKYLLQEPTLPEPPKYYDTETIKINSSHYCVYCGELAQLSMERYHPHEHMADVEHYFCTCSTAQLELQKTLLIDNLAAQFVLPINTEKLNELKYQAELESLNRRYSR